MAESSVGARGLMQLMPDTAEWIAGKKKVSGYAFERMYDPESNISFGCWYLRYLANLFHGDPVCVSCAYHAGQGQVTAWLSDVSIYDLVYESLIYIDDDYNPQGKLAQSWETSSNGKTWTFYLRPSVTFSDGTPLTAQDVVASAQYILDRANDESTTDSGFYANLKYFISSISASR